MSTELSAEIGILDLRVGISVGTTWRECGGVNRWPSLHSLQARGCSRAIEMFVSSVTPSRHPGISEVTSGNVGGHPMHPHHMLLGYLGPHGVLGDAEIPSIPIRKVSQSYGSDIGPSSYRCPDVMSKSRRRVLRPDICSDPNHD